MDDPYIIYRRPDFVSQVEWVINLRLQLLKQSIPLEHIEWVQEQIREHQGIQQVVIVYNFAELFVAYVPFPIPFYHCILLLLYRSTPNNVSMHN